MVVICTKWRVESSHNYTFTVPLSPQVFFPFSEKKEVKDSRLLSRGIFTFLKDCSVERAMLN